MADYKKIITFIKKWEGGFSNHPNDKGGATMAGITMSTYKTYCAKKGKKTPTVTDLKNMSNAEWEDIFKTMYWDKAKLDQVKSQKVANIIVQMIWGSGASQIKTVQKLVGVTADGVVGAKTLAAINAKDETILFDMLYAKRAMYFQQICITTPSNKVFLKGWLNRLADLKKFCEQ